MASRCLRRSPGIGPSRNRQPVRGRLAGGFDVEVTPDFAISVVAQYRDLKQVIEDIGYMTSTGDINYFIGNPDGTYPDQCGPISNWEGSVVGAPQPWAKPIRRYKALTIKANKRFSNHWFMNANYVLSSLKGNFEAAAEDIQLLGATATLHSTTTFRMASSRETLTDSSPATEDTSSRSRVLTNLIGASHSAVPLIS